jgi:hypothetical protein
MSASGSGPKDLKKHARTTPRKKGTLRDASERVRKAAEAARKRPGTPSPVEQEGTALSERADSLQTRLSDLRSEASLAGLRDRVEDLDSSLSGLPATLEEVRKGGYVYRAYLEKKVEVLRQQWQGLRQSIDREAAQQGQQLVRQADTLQRRLSGMGSRLEAAKLDSLERDIDMLAGKVGDAQRALQGTFDTIQSNVGQTEGQLRKVRWLLQQVSGASFRLRPEEFPVDGVEAQYITEGEKKGPKGVLFLTDQRLLFEQKEDVATKKFLFITTERKRMHELLLEAPIGSVQQSEAIERGAVFRKDFLELAFGAQATVSQALFRIEADSDAWQALIGRVASGDIAQERVGAETAPAVEVSVADVPTNCPTCGAGFTAEIVRGMQSISCDYCGTVIRL